jgi:cytochrome P450
MTTGALDTRDFDDLTSPAAFDDPYTFFGTLRDEEPVHWNGLAHLWIVTGHAEASRIFRDPAGFSSDSPYPADPSTAYPPIDEADWEVALWFRETYRPFIFRDPPDHLHMRQAIHRWFTPRAVERWRVELRKLVLELIEEPRETGVMEVKQDVALPLPLKTISWMMGIPEADAPRLSETVASFIDESASPHRFRVMAESWQELMDYFTPLLESRAKEPTDDLITILADAERQGIYDRMACLATLTNLMQAGHETTLSLITSGLLSFIRNPGQWDLLRTDPEGLASAATEECLRYEPPLKLLTRWVTNDVELGGKLVGAGQMVIVVPPAANRDPEVFADPNRFDITRSPNPHIAFGAGIHHCLGAALARVEAQEAFKALAETFPRLYLQNEEIEWMKSHGVRQLRSLPVTCGR